MAVNIHVQVININSLFHFFLYFTIKLKNGVMMCSFNHGCTAKMYIVIYVAAVPSVR
jgi:hypothetical protein